MYKELLDGLRDGTSVKVVGLDSENMPRFRAMLRRVEAAMQQSLSVTYMAWFHKDDAGKPRIGTSALVEVTD